MYFWQNYFFHCAFTRYEAGLSIDEIWSYQKLENDGEGDDNDGAAAVISDATGAAAGVSSAVGGKTHEEESVVFDGSDAEPGNNPTEPVFHNDDGVDPSSAAAAVSGGTPESTNQSGDGAQSTNGFELVDDEDGDDGVVGDPELDELEAEIARELEGM